MFFVFLGKMLYVCPPKGPGTTAELFGFQGSAAEAGPIRLRSGVLNLVFIEVHQPSHQLSFVTGPRQGGAPGSRTLAAVSPAAPRSFGYVAFVSVVLGGRGGAAERGSLELSWASLGRGLDILGEVLGGPLWVLGESWEASESLGGGKYE